MGGGDRGVGGGNGGYRKMECWEIAQKSFFSPPLETGTWTGLEPVHICILK